MACPSKIFHNDVSKALFLLMVAALLFSIMGIFVRYASQTMDSFSIVFFRNVVGLVIFVPLLLKKGSTFFKTDKLWMHTWRSLAGVGSMYGLIYAIGHTKLSNAMVFSYSSPLLIPLLAWWFLKEKITPVMIISSVVGLLGVLLVAKPDAGVFDVVSLVGLSSCILSALAFVTIRALTISEPPERVVFYFCVFGTLISVIPMGWYWRTFTWQELALVSIAGVLASISQLCMSYAYSLAPASQIGGMNYSAIVFAGVWGYVWWGEIPDSLGLLGFLLVGGAIGTSYLFTPKSMIN